MPASTVVPASGSGITVATTAGGTSWAADGAGAPASAASASHTAAMVSTTAPARAAPTSVTSSWLSSPPRPAAALVTRLRPPTSRPRAWAANASSTVDIPTRSAPRVASMRISAGVS